MALRTICRDDMGKEAVRDGLKKVKLVNVKSNDDKKMTFEGGVLEMHVAYAQGAGRPDRRQRNLRHAHEGPVAVKIAPCGRGSAVDRTHCRF